MTSPFPGMNPYLENPDLWPGVHGRIIVNLADFLSSQLRPQYFVSIEERIYQTTIDDRILVGIPDVIVQNSKTANLQTQNLVVASPEIKPKKVQVPLLETVKERYLEIKRVDTKAVITVIEILSPKNKRSGEGRNVYENKRQLILASFTHLVEIDLLRFGQPMLVFGDEMQSDYRILVSRSEKRPEADLYDFNLQDVIPTFMLPLSSGDREILVNLQTLLTGIYERGSYDLVIDYHQNPQFPLSAANLVWLDELLKNKGLR